MSEVVTIERREHAGVVTLHRPAKLNAISAEMERELCDAVGSPEVQRSSCVVFTGGPDVFSAGADLSVTRGYEPEEIIGHYQGTGDFAERVAALPQPTLSAIAGYCIGGGLELALATDFRIAEPTAEFRFPEVALGILPSWGGAVRAVRLLGAAAAKELILLRDGVDHPWCRRPNCRDRPGSNSRISVGAARLTISNRPMEPMMTPRARPGVGARSDGRRPATPAFVRVHGERRNGEPI